MSEGFDGLLIASLWHKVLCCWRHGMLAVGLLSCADYLSLAPTGV